MGKGGDWWMGIIAEGIPRGGQVLCTPVSLGYPLSVFNKSLLSKSIAGVPFDLVRRFRAALLLRHTCMRLCCNGVASCVAA